MALLGPWLAALTLVEHALGDAEAYSKPDHSSEDVTVGSAKGTVTSDSKVSVTPSGSRLIVDVEVKTSGEVTGADGRLAYRINSVGHAHIEVQACPDAQGVAPAKMEFSGNEDFFGSADGGRAGASWQADRTADARIYADGEAEGWTTK